LKVTQTRDNIVMNRFRLILLLAIVGIVFIAGLLAPKWYYAHQSTKLSATFHNELAGLGARSIPSGDVPVGAILVYHDSIIGRGYNTVLKDHAAGGHAEINAISDAMQKLGMVRFRTLDHSALTLFSTYEPCPMCKGAIEEYHIKKVVFIKPKIMKDWLQSDLKNIRYEWYKRRTLPDGLQDSLFRLYPDYKE